MAFRVYHILLICTTTQFHRLRLFSLSRLSCSSLPSKFDFDSLRIEYPFVHIPDEDIAAIEVDPEFFAGYFTPYSEAGSAAQLSQVEMFFHHAVALVPLTICALADFVGDNLVPSFYEALSEHGAFPREKLDWEADNFLGNWLALRPLLDTWFLKHVKLDSWQSEILRGLIDYEAHRLHFVNGDITVMDAALTSGENWAAFALTVDLVALLERMRSHVQLTSELLRAGIIVLVRKGQASFEAYLIVNSLLPKLKQHQLDIVSEFNR